MYKKKEIIENVATYLICDDNLLVCYNREGGNYSLALNGVNLGSTDVTDYFLTRHNILFNRDGDSATYVYNLEQRTLSSLCDGWSPVFHRKNSHIIYKDVNNRFHYKTELLEDLHLSQYRFSILIAEGGISRNASEIYRVDGCDNILWSFPFEALGENKVYSPGKVDRITNILGVVGDLLWFKTDFARLIALDITTGKPVYQLSCNVADKDKPQYKMVEGIGDCYLREEDKAIVCISSFHFQVIDSSSGEVIECFAFAEVDPEGIGRFSVFSPLLQGDYFTFLAVMDTDWHGIGRVGIFDYKARKLVWTEEIIPPEERKATRNCLVSSQPLYISGDKLYIRDIKHTLHIFQRE